MEELYITKDELKIELRKRRNQLRKLEFIEYLSFFICIFANLINQTLLWILLVSISGLCGLEFHLRANQEGENIRQIELKINKKKKFLDREGNE